MQLLHLAFLWIQTARSTGGLRRIPSNRAASPPATLTLTSQPDSVSAPRPRKHALSSLRVPPRPSRGVTAATSHLGSSPTSHRAQGPCPSAATATSTLRYICARRTHSPALPPAARPVPTSPSFPTDLSSAVSSPTLVRFCDSVRTRSFAASTPANMAGDNSALISVRYDQEQRPLMKCPLYLFFFEFYVSTSHDTRNQRAQILVLRCVVVRSTEAPWSLPPCASSSTPPPAGLFKPTPPLQPSTFSRGMLQDFLSLVYASSVRRPSWS